MVYTVDELAIKKIKYKTEGEYKNLLRITTEHVQREYVQKCHGGSSR